MKNSILLFLFLIPAFLFAQYPTTGNKSRLGWQTTGDGLIWRGVAGDTVNKPNNRNYPYFQLDTVNAVLYRYIQTRQQWQPVSENVDIDSLIYATRYWVNSNFFPLPGGFLTGTGGNGFVGFPVQSSTPATPATGFSLYAGSTGNNISWMQSDGFFRRLVSPVTGTPRQYQFMARSYTLGDSADIANNVTSIAANYIATSNGTNLVARNLFDNNTYVGILNNKPFSLGQWTTAGRPAGTIGYMGWNTTLTGIDWYNGTRWATGLESTFARGTQTYIPYFDANGQITQTALFKLTGAANLFANNHFINAVTGGYYGTDSGQGLELSGASTNLRIFGSGSTFFGAVNTNGGATIYRAYTSTRRLNANISATTISGLTGGDYSVTSQAALSGGSNGRDLTVHGGDADNASAGASSGNLILRGGRATSASTNPTQGTILFQTAPNTTSGAAVQRGKITQGGFWNIGADATPTEEMDVNGDLRIRDSLRLATTPAHTSIAGLATKSATGEWIGLATLGTGLSYSGGVLSATGASTWLKPELESVGNVKISSTNSLTFKQGTTRWTGSSEQLGTSITPGNIYLRKTSSGDFGATLHFADTLGVVDNDFYFEQDDRNTVQTDGFGAQLNLVANSTKLPGSFRWAYGVRVDTSSTIGEIMILYGDRFASTTQPITHKFVSGIQNAKTIPGFDFVSAGADGKMAFRVNSNINLRQNGKFFLALDSTFSFDPSTDLLQLSQYGGNTKTATALSKTFSTLTGFATDGTVLNVEQKRDTTIYVTDADYNFSAAITSTNILKRYNNIVIYSKLSASSTSDNQIFLHTPSSDFLQCTIIIYSNDASTDSDATSVDFTTNGAVDGAGGTLSSYAMAPGQRVEIRVADDGGYKWFFN